VNRTWPSLGNHLTLCFVAAAAATCAVACDTGGSATSSAPVAAEPVPKATASMQLAATAPTPPAPEEPTPPASEAAPSAPPGASANVDAPTPTAEGGKSVVKGPPAQDEPFVTWLQASAPLAAKGKGEITVVLEAKKPYKCNDKYPYKFKVGSSTGLTVADTTVRGMQIGKERSTMVIPVTVGDPGKASLTGELSFSVCTDDKCLIEKQTLTISLDVQS